MLIECDATEDEEGEEATEKEEKTPPSEPKEKQMSRELELSLHAMDGSSSPKTLRLLGQVKRKLVSILLDTGSTHNFIDPRAV